MTPLCLMNNREQSELANIVRPALTRNKTTADSFPKNLEDSIVERIQGLRAISKLNSNMTQRRYNTNLDRRIQRQPIFQKGDVIYADEPPGELVKQEDNDHSRKLALKKWVSSKSTNIWRIRPCLTYTLMTKSYPLTVSPVPSEP